MKIVIKEVTKYIKKALILDSVNLEFRSGQVYGLQGPNGSGKTMLMRLVAGLIRPTTGQVYIDGRELGKDLDFPESIGMLIESPAFLPEYTGFKNLELLAGIKGKASLEQIRCAIADVGLSAADRRKYGKYSLGMKQRLAIAGTLMEEPELILLDEPTNALDDKGVEQICQLIRRERDRGSLIIAACHDASILERISDEIYSVYEGRVERKVTL